MYGMAKSQLNVYYPQNLEADIESYRQENGLESKSEAGRQLLRRGVERWQEERRQVSSTVGARVLTRGAELALISAVFAVIVGIGLGTVQLFQLSGGFGVIAAVLYAVYGALVRYKTGSWGVA